MAKFKIEHSDGQSFLVIQGQKGQQISEREFYAINNGLVPGLLKADLVKKGNTFKLNYNISGYISLREFLLNPLNKTSFANLLNNILTNLKALQNAYYNHQFIMMDMNAAMVNPTTQQVSFVYVPITFYESGTNLKQFLLSIIQCCSFVPGENTDYVRDYIRILNNGINFSIFDLEEYIKHLNGDDGNVKQAKKCTRCGAVIQPNMNFCSSCGVKVSGLNTNKPHGVYDPAKPTVREKPPELEISVQTSVPKTQQEYSGTISSSYDVNQSVQTRTNENAQFPVSEPVNVVNPIPAAQQTVPYLIRVKTGEQIKLTDSFRIGKDPFNSEYCVRDNNAISRCHVLIKKISDRWFITDLNSTNKTFINDGVIQPRIDVELFNGMNIRLANEDFIFNLY